MIKNIITKNNFTLKKCSSILENSKICLLGFNDSTKFHYKQLKNYNKNVIIGLDKESNAYNEAQTYGFKENKNLFSIEDGVSNSNIIKFLFNENDIQKYWRKIEPYLYNNDTLYFNNVNIMKFKSTNKVIIPNDTNVVVLNPNYNYNSDCKVKSSSYLIYQNKSNSKDILCSLAFYLDNDYIYETDFDKMFLGNLYQKEIILNKIIFSVLDSTFNKLIEEDYTPLEAYNIVYTKTLDDLNNKNLNALQIDGFDENIKNILENYYDNIYDNYSDFYNNKYSENNETNEFLNIYKDVNVLNKKIIKYKDIFYNYGKYDKSWLKYIS